MTDSIHRLGLALDDIAAELEEMPLEQALEIIAAVAELADLDEPGYLDQVAAAAGAAWRLAPALTGTHAPDHQPAPRNGPPAGSDLAPSKPWPSGTPDRATCACWIRIFAGHDRSRQRPGGPAWWCARRARRCSAVHDPIANATCDVCGHVAGPAHGDGIRAASLVLGPLTYRVGACGRCYLDWPVRPEETA